MNKKKINNIKLISNDWEPARAFRFICDVPGIESFRCTKVKIPKFKWNNNGTCITDEKLIVHYYEYGPESTIKQIDNLNKKFKNDLIPIKITFLDGVGCKIFELKFICDVEYAEMVDLNYMNSGIISTIVSFRVYEINV